VLITQPVPVEASASWHIHAVRRGHATSRGPQLLRDFLLYAERGHLDSSVARGAAETESPFEREVFMELTRRGIDLQPQVGVAGYRIDFGVRDAELPGRFLCGIECDGAAYHSSEAARDRDRLRQQVLEDRGWTIYRLWSTDWFKDRASQIERLLGLIESTRRKAREEQEAEREARERLAALAQEEAQQAQDGDSAVILSGDVPVRVAPEAQLYTFADTPLLHFGQDFHAAPASFISQAIDDAVSVEAPLHIKDLATRVVARWGYNQVGPAMLRRIRAVVGEKARQRQIRLSEDFIYKAAADGSVQVRSRAGTKITPERIAPEEYREAVLMILRAGDGLERRALVNAVRALFGFSRTGTTLDAAIGAVINRLLAEEVLGEGSMGIKLRS
jgi:very-short-patch-repair endonuclease